MPNLNQTIDRSLSISRSVATVLDRRVREAYAAYSERVRRSQAAYVASGPPGNRLNPQQAWRDWWEYGVDFAQRSVLFWDAIRAKDLDEKAALEAKRAAEEAMQNKASKEEIAHAEAELSIALAQLEAIRKLRHRA